MRLQYERVNGAAEDVKATIEQSAGAMKLILKDTSESWLLQFSQV